jgi:hypothetical protein
MSAFAQSWATYLNTNNVFEHNPAAGKNKYGENISWMWSSATGKYLYI